MSYTKLFMHTHYSREQKETVKCESIYLFSLMIKSIPVKEERKNMSSYHINRVYIIVYAKESETLPVKL